MKDGQVTEGINGQELRQARFPQARRGYDREAVHAFLDGVADWVESGAADGSQASSQITSEFAKVGERTAGILTAAEEAAGKLRSDAKEYVDELRSSAEAEARQVRLNASQKSDELIAEAEAKAEKIIDEAIMRRRSLNQALVTLVERRDEIADEAQRLADDLLEAVDAVRSDAREEPEVAEDQMEVEPVADEPTALEPPDERETTVHESAAR